MILDINCKFCGVKTGQLELPDIRAVLSSAKDDSLSEIEGIGFYQEEISRRLAEGTMGEKQAAYERKKVEKTLAAIRSHIDMIDAEIAKIPESDPRHDISHESHHIADSRCDACIEEHGHFGQEKKEE